MNVLLATLNVAGELASDEIGLISVGSTLREGGHRVHFIECRENRVEDMDALRAFEPSVLGIGIYTITKKASLELVESLRQIFPEIVVCAGGYFPTYFSEELLATSSAIDFVVRGEGEPILLNALDHLDRLDCVPGVTYREGKEVVVNRGGEIVPDLNILPFAMDDSIYSNQGTDLIYVSSSRGCQTNCSFCLASSFNKKWRGADTEKVVDGIAEIYHKYGKRNFGFTDNSFEDSLARRAGTPGSAHSEGPQDVGDEVMGSRMKRIAQGLIDRELRLSYEINATASFYKIAGDELMPLLLKSGLASVYIGLESGNEEDLALYRKRATLADNRASLEFFRRWGIHPSLGFISFNPYSTFDRLRGNLDFLNEFDLCGQLFFANRLLLYRGARIIHQVEADGLLLEGRFGSDHGYRFVDPAVETLADFLKGFVQPFREKKLYSWALPHLFGIYRSKLSYFRRELDHPNDLVTSGLVAMENLLDEAQRELSERNHRLFGRLVDLAEEGWSESEAFRLAESGFRFERSVERVNEILTFKEKLDGLLTQAGFHANIV